MLTNWLALVEFECSLHAVPRYYSLLGQRKAVQRLLVTQRG